MKNKCNLIIGSSGFIGNSLIKNINKQHDFYTISKKKKSISSKKHFTVDVKKYHKVKMIITQLKKKYKKIDVFYLAGESSVENSIINSRSSINNSIISFHNLILSLKNHKSTIIFASSGSVYDSRNKTSFSEKDVLRPPSPYAAIKYASEGIAMSYCETHGMDIRIARMFSVFGENMNRFFIYDLVKKLKNSNKKILLKGSGNQERDYLHVDDVAKGLLIIMKNGSKGEVYNLCSGRPIKLKNLAEKIKIILKKNNVKIFWDNKKTKGVRDRWYGDNKKIKSIGFNCKKLFSNRLKSTIDYIFLNLNRINKIKN